jgi:hypothetical protein
VTQLQQEEEAARSIEQTHHPPQDKLARSAEMYADAGFAFAASYSPAPPFDFPSAPAATLPQGACIPVPMDDTYAAISDTSAHLVSSSSSYFVSRTRNFFRYLFKCSLERISFCCSIYFLLFRNAPRPKKYIFSFRPHLDIYVVWTKSIVYPAGNTICV